MIVSPHISPIISRVGKLVQTDDSWECGVWSAYHWIVEHRQDPYRPHIFMVIGDCGIPRIDLSKPSHSAADILEHLLRAMLKPAHGIITPRRPTRIYCADAEVVALLTPYMSQIGISCEVRDTSAEWRKHQCCFELSLNHGKEQLAGLATIPGASLAVQAHFYELAAAYYELKPWRTLNDAHPLEIRCPATSAPRYGVVIGSGGEIFGLVVYDTEAQARAIINDENPDSYNSLLLFYSEQTTMSFEDLDAIAEHGWAVPNPEAYPILGRSVEDNILQPSLSDLVWMEGALAALLQYLREHIQLDGRKVMPAELTLPVQTTSGTISVALRLPAF